MNGVFINEKLKFGKAVFKRMRYEGFGYEDLVRFCGYRRIYGDFEFNFERKIVM